MAQTDLWNPRAQRSIPLALIALTLALVIARIVMAVWGDNGGDAPADRPVRGGDRASAERAADLVNWVPLAEAEQRARAANKLLLYDFTAEWCGPCHQLDAVVFRDERLAAMINERFIAVRVTDRQREDGRNTPVVDQLQQRYSVNGFPTLVFTNARGEALARMDGFAGPHAFERTVRSIPG